jgi:hypothetical protein
MKIYKMLDISTGHIPYQDVQLLEDPQSLPFTCAIYEEGFIVSTVMFSDPGLVEKLKQKKSFSPDFFKIIGRALVERCSHINFDRDGEEYEEFTKFNW